MHSATSYHKEDEVESLKEGHFGTVILPFVRRLSFIRKSIMYWNYWKKIC